MQSHVMPSNLSQRSNNPHGLKGKLDQEHHLKLFTPPQSSRSSFAQLPTQTAAHSGLPRWTPQVVSQGDSFIRFDRSTEDEDEYDDDSETVMEEGEEEDEEDEGDHHSQLVGPQFARLASLREPSPSGTLLLSTEDPEDFDVLDINEARQTEEALCSLSGPISSTLTQYRNQFNQWELEDNPPQSVVHASIMIDQCLAKFVYTLEPLKWIADDLFQFCGFLNQLSSFLSGLDHANGHLPLPLETITPLWNGLNRLADHVTSVEEGLSETSLAINELCDWVDGLLTPALAEVKFPNAEANSQVSQILDVHSYLCESLVKACAILKVYLKCMRRIQWSISRFQSIISSSNDDDSSVYFPVRPALVWSSKWTASMTPIINSLGVFHAISDVIQVHCAGQFSFNSSDREDQSAPCPDADSVILYSQPSLVCFDIKPGFQNASISYS